VVAETKGYPPGSPLAPDLGADYYRVLRGRLHVQTAEGLFGPTGPKRPGSSGAQVTAKSAGSVAVSPRTTTTAEVTCLVLAGSTPRHEPTVPMADRSSSRLSMLTPTFWSHSSTAT
jgi:hypothetical protein